MKEVIGIQVTFMLEIKVQKYIFLANLRTEKEGICGK